MTKKTSFWISISFLVLACISAVFYLVNKDQPVYANELIGRVSESFKQDLKVFLHNAENTVAQLNSDIQKIDVDETSADQLDITFSQMIQNEKFLQGVIVFGKDMNYVIYREENSWVTSHNNMSDSSITWTRLDNNFNETSTWLDTYNFFMAQKELDVLKIPDLKPGEHLWRTAQSKRPSNRDLFFNIFRLKEGENDDIIAFMYRTQELGMRFSRVLQFENPLVSVITSRNSLISPIKTDDPEKIDMYSELEKKVKESYNSWKETEPNKAMAVSFTSMNTDFWVGIDTISPVLGVKGFAVTISDPDLMNNKEKLDEVFLYLSILFLIFAIAAFLPVYRANLKKKSGPKNNLIALTDEKIHELISGGETEFIEFKSSLRWDFREGKANKSLEDVILKSIAAFSNAKGGILFIGVTDEMEIIGLDNDFKTLKKQDVDYFELHLRKLINNQFGIRYSNKFLLMQFPDFNGKKICIVQVSAGDKPIYVKTRNKQGHEVEKFFVRSGNASQEISSLKEINEYISSRFE